MRGKILIVAAVSVCATLSGAACGRSTRQNSMNTVSEAPNNAPVTLQVTNNHHQDVDVYAADGSQRWRLGLITSGQTQEFTVPIAATRSGGDFNLIVHPVGGGGDFSTGRVLVSPGDEVLLTIDPILSHTAFTVSQR